MMDDSAGSDCGKIGFDRSRVRILLCDKDSVAAQQVKELLCRCSYQVSVVTTARQVVEVLNLSDSRVDLVLAEAELPNGKGFKMLRHIVKRENFKHIPIVMMSARDEMAAVVKCLRLGAADYLVKPLRINELLNLWTHMWRRRRMLGLAEKHVVNGPLASKNIIAEIFVSDTSESNAISTGIFSEDSNDTRFMFKESGLTPISEDQVEASSGLDLSLKSSSEKPKGTQFHQRAELRLSPLTKSAFKTGETSAFLTYARSSNRPPTTDKLSEKLDVTNEPLAFKITTDMQPASSGRLVEVPKLILEPVEVEVQVQVEAQGQVEAQVQVEAQGGDGTSGGQVDSNGGSASPEARQLEHEFSWGNASVRHEGVGGPEQYPVMNDPRAAHAAHAAGVPVFNPIGQSHLMSPMMVTHSLHPSSLLQPGIHYYHAVPQEASMATGLRHLHPAPTISYYPFPIHLPSHQVGPWHALPSAPLPEKKPGVAERREAALTKFRQKRKDRCYEKKIRYASRKRLAEQRPRIKGQFVRRYEEEDEDDEETASPESGVEVIEVTQ